MSDTGKVRKGNEDACRVYHDLPLVQRAGRGSLFVVADGLGGYRGGGQASRMAVDQFAFYFQLPDKEFHPEGSLEKLVFRTNEVIREMSTEPDSTYYGMGTTLTLLHFHAPDNARVVLLHAGDSRCYRVRGGAIAQVSHDHKVESGQLSNHVGIGPAFKLEKQRRTTVPGDRWLLCSDGVSSYLEDPQILALLAACPDAQVAAESLVAAAVEVSEDNCTAIVIDVLP